MANYCLNFTFGTYPARLEILFFAPGDEIVLHLFCEGVGLDIALQTRKHSETNNQLERLLVTITDFDRHHSPNFDSAWHGNAMKTRRESVLASTVQDALLAAFVLPENLEQHLLISRVQSNEQIDERGLAIIGASCALHLLNPDYCETPLCAMSVCMTEEVFKTNSNALHCERGVCELLTVVNTHGLVFAKLRGTEVKEFECIQYLNMAHDHARNLLDLLIRFCRYFYSKRVRPNTVPANKFARHALIYSQSFRACLKVLAPMHLNGCQICRLVNRLYRFTLESL